MHWVCGGRFVQQNCHPDRSVAQWRDLLYLLPILYYSFATGVASFAPVLHSAKGLMVVTGSSRRFTLARR